jgi:hypothetical protein
MLLKQVIMSALLTVTIIMAINATLLTGKVAYKAEYHYNNVGD